MNQAVARIRRFMVSGRPHQIVTVNLDFVSIASRDATFRATINSADLAVADGMPLVWLSRLKAQPLAERVAGVDLMSESCRLAAQNGKSVFLLGAGAARADVSGSARRGHLFAIDRCARRGRKRAHLADDRARGA
jgi:N-acetylglucosaminyldiphosphoundecaprenol N-acetyl-beta-D-mannosaminyltransferase